MTTRLPPDKLARLARAARIHVIGGSGAGKTTLARQIGKELSLPVHHLDELVLPDDGHSLRSAEDRGAVLFRILATRRWVTEGIYVEGSGPLLNAADIVVWLDHVSSAAATRRVLRRFLHGAMSEVRGRHGLDRFLRVRDYARQALALMRATLETWRYHAADSSVTGHDGPPSRAQTEAILRPYAEKTLHCRTPSDVAQLLDALQ